MAGESLLLVVVNSKAMSQHCLTGEEDVIKLSAGEALPLATASAKANIRKRIGCICGFSCGNYHCRTMLQIVDDEFC